ncbi:MAG: hypothetical protein H6861_08265 [Rhodospirillales bacterium]|nr:hypothetical protein [Rhodospirillales bacterium]
MSVLDWPLDWPLGIYPRSQKFYLAHKSKSWQSDFTGQRQVTEQTGTRWVAEFSFVLRQSQAAVMDALIARLKGEAGEIYVPDFRRNSAYAVPDSMDAYAAEVGTTFFDDRYDFDDETAEDGLLTTEQSPPLGMEANAPFGSGFDIPLEFPFRTELLTESGDDLIWDGVALAFETDKGFILTLEHGAELEIAVEEGFTFWTQDEQEIPVQVGGGFFEGEGQPTIIDAADHNLNVTGLAPYREILSAGEGFMPRLGQSYLILGSVVTDIDGAVLIPIMPKLREAVPPQPLVVGMVKVLMRLASDEAAENIVNHRLQTRYTLTFEEILK